MWSSEKKDAEDHETDRFRMHYSEGADPQGRYALSTGKRLPTFQRVIVPPSSGSGIPRCNAAATSDFFPRVKVQSWTTVLH
jgi:hypothetical protein